MLMRLRQSYAYALEGVALRVGEHADVGVAVDDARKETSEPPVAVLQVVREQPEAEQQVLREPRAEHHVHDHQLEHHCDEKSMSSYSYNSC